MYVYLRGLFVMYLTVSIKLEISSSETERHPLFKLTDMPNQVSVLEGSHTDFSLFVTNLALIRVLRTNFDEVSDFEYQNSIKKSSSKNQAILIASTLVNTKGAVLSSKGRTAKAK